MAKLVADLREYKRGYKKNYESYKTLYNNNAHSRARKMLLAYSDECGLKYLVLKQWQIINYRDIADLVNNKDNPRNTIIKTHNLEMLMKELGQAGMFRFPTKLKSSRGEAVNTENFHQFCRYEIYAADGLHSEESAFEDVLRNIADWIGERMCEEGV